MNTKPPLYVSYEEREVQMSRGCLASMELYHDNNTLKATKPCYAKSQLRKPPRFFRPKYKNLTWRRHQWKNFPRYWPFVRGIHQWPVNSPHKDQWHEAFMTFLSAPWIKDWLNNRDTGDLRRHRIHYGVIVMILTDYSRNLASDEMYHLSNIWSSWLLKY